MSKAKKIGSLDLHELLADIYCGYRGVDAPVTSQTESLWREIERLEEAGR